MKSMLINRELAKEVTRLTEFYSVITITGPRQSGKTTLCRSLFPDFEYFNLEDRETLEIVSSDPKGFLLGSHNNIIVDEAQNCPEIFSYIQVFSDENPERKFVLSGSSNFSLLQGISQSLAGRTAILTLLPLSVREIRTVFPDASTDELIVAGGYPRLWAKHGFPSNTFYKNYYSTYIERDVRQIINVKDMLLFQKFIRLCAGRIGTELNLSHLSNEVGVSVSTISNWVSLLAASYIIHLLPPYSVNIGKRLVKTPKLYFYDVGLACYLLGIEENSQLQYHPLRGNLFENLVINEAVKSRLNKGKDPNLYFYRDKSGNEADMLYEGTSGLRAFEIKSAHTFNSEFLKGLKYVKRIFGEKVLESTVIYDGDSSVTATDYSLLNIRDFDGL